MLRTLLLLSLGAVLTAASTVSSENQSPNQTESSSGVSETVFQTRAGKITVYLPADMAAGDTISGTVIAEPAPAKDPKQQQKNAAELNGYVVELEKNRSTAGDKNLRWKLPSVISGGSLSLLLMDSKGKVIGQSSVAVAATPPAPAGNFQLPNLAQPGRPIQIQGPFDGDSANTSAKLGGADLPILAESPRQAVFRNPQDKPGILPVALNENGVTTNGSTRNIRIDLTAPKTSLMRGESTELKVEVNGLAGLTEPLPLRLRNQTPEVVNVAGGNDQILRVAAGSAPSQTFNRTVTGVSSGRFNIVADIVSSTEPSVAQATASSTPMTAPGTTPSTTRPSPSPVSMPTSTVPPTTGVATTPTATPSPPGPEPTIPNVAVPVSGVAAVPMPTPERKENPCCQKIRDANDPEFRTRLVWRDGANNFELMGPFLFLEVNGVRAKWKFDRNLEEVFCYLDKYEIDSEVKQVSETGLKDGKTTEKQETISLLFAGPDPDNKSARPHKFFHFMASRLEDNKVKEYEVSLTVDERYCSWTLQVFGQNKLAEFTSPPPRDPNEILAQLQKALLPQRAYQDGSWWSNMYRSFGEIQQWLAWLGNHPNDQQKEQIDKAYNEWRNVLRYAMADIKGGANGLTPDDRKTMDELGRLLNNEHPTGAELFQIFQKFNSLWERFNQTGAVF